MHCREDVPMSAGDDSGILVLVFYDAKNSTTISRRRGGTSIMIIMMMNTFRFISKQPCMFAVLVLKNQTHHIAEVSLG